MTDEPADTETAEPFSPAQQRAVGRLVARARADARERLMTGALALEHVIGQAVASAVSAEMSKQQRQPDPDPHDFEGLVVRHGRARALELWVHTRTNGRAR